jgi:hypothetical protein
MTNFNPALCRIVRGSNFAVEYLGQFENILYWSDLGLMCNRLRKKEGQKPRDTGPVS